jgi:RHS repeat-associated protein
MAPLALVHEGRAFFISFDQAGTPTEIWDEDERLVALISSGAYGAGRAIEWLVGPPFPLPFLFQGQFCDEETGLNYNRFRYYSPPTGRFITQDPIGYAGDLNLYIYPSNPVTWIDPLGLACPDPIPLRCGTRKKKFSPCEAKAAMAKVERMNKGKRTRCANASQCRSGRQKQHYEKNCSGADIKGGYDVDHSKEIQQGGADLCCKNLMPIPATPNRSLGGQLKYRMGCAPFGSVLPTFALGSPCTAKSYTDQCKQDFTPGRKKPGAPPENCEERSGEECEP